MIYVIWRQPQFTEAIISITLFFFMTEKVHCVCAAHFLSPSALDWLCNLAAIDSAGCTRMCQCLCGRLEWHSWGTAPCCFLQKPDVFAFLLRMCENSCSSYSLDICFVSYDKSRKTCFYFVGWLFLFVFTSM